MLYIINKNNNSVENNQQEKDFKNSFEKIWNCQKLYVIFIKII